MLKKILLLTVILSFVGTVLCAAHPQAKLEFEQYCAYFNYPMKKYEVITDDGYILTVYRIQKRGTQIVEGLKPILFQHGLLDSSDGWIINDAFRAPALIAANRGYDVWLGNSRGNKHSRKHVRYNPDKDKEFWQFSFQHMADYDLPAVFTHIFNITKQKIHYIGHSQGTIQMFVALSKHNPVIEQYLDKYFAFGPVAYVKNSKSNLINMLDHSLVLQWFKLRGINEFLPSANWFQTDVGIAFCSTFAKVCGDLMTQIMDGDASLDNYERYDVLIGHFPAGTSTMNMAHWKQLMDTGRFESFDYGSSR